LSTTYKTAIGDTFELISRKKYGTEANAGLIAEANPGAVEPLATGITVILPTIPGAVQNIKQNTPANNPDEVAVLIAGKRFKFWSEVRITRSIDTMDTVEFSAPFEADNPEFKNTFKPFSFQDIEVTVGGAPLFTGTMVGVTPALGPDGKTVDTSGYATPGVLNDCTPPASAFPLEYNNQNLEDIAKKITAPFGITVVFDVSPGPRFERVAPNSGQTVLAFLSGLAKQRNIVISSTAKGELLFQQSVGSGKPVAILRQGESPVVAVTPFFNPQEYYSHITGIEPVIVGLAGSKFTVKNPRLKGITRPMTFTAEDTEAGTLKDAVKAKASRMFGNMVSYSVSVSTWRDPSGKLWSPNTEVSLQAKSAMIYNAYTFIIRSVEFIRTRDSATAVLNIVIPGAFSGILPEVLPWDE